MVTERGLQLSWEWHKAKIMFRQRIPPSLFCSIPSLLCLPVLDSTLSQASSLLYTNTV